MNRFQFLVAQFGKSAKRQLSSSMLVDPEDIPGGGWSVKVDRCWRIGKVNQRAPASLRARKAGEFAAIRTFEQQDSSRWVLVEVIPMVSPEDAAMALPAAKLSFAIDPESRAIVGSESTVVLDYDMGLSNVEALEMPYSSPTQSAMYRYVVGTLDRVIVVIGCSGLGEGWTWEEIQPVGALQVEKVRKTITKSRLD